MNVLDPKSPRYPGTHTLLLGAGGMGGYAGFVFVSLGLLPSPLPHFGMDALMSGALGMVVGYLFGIGTYYAERDVLNEGVLRVTAFVAAMASAALIVGFVTAFFGSAAYV